MAHEKNSEPAPPIQTPPIQIRVSKQALSELDAAAKRNGRSRNAEAAARIERGLGGESSYPEERALLDFVSIVTAGAGGLIGVCGPSGRAINLALVKGALIDLLDALGAEDDEKAVAMGRGYGKQTIERAKRAAGKEPSRRSPAEETLAEAAAAWGLQGNNNG